MSDEPPSGAALDADGFAPCRPILAELAIGTTVTAAVEVWPVPVGPPRVELGWPYGAAIVPVPCNPFVERPAENRG